MLKNFNFEENEFLKGFLAKHPGDSPVVIDFEALDEFDTLKRFQLLTSNHLWVCVNDEMKKELSATFKDKMELSIQQLG